MVTFTLQRAGFDVSEAEDGEKALAALRAAPVDLVITDLNMPRMDGVALIRALRADAGCRAVPILMLTTESDPAKKAEGRSAGATGWIVKPFDPRKADRGCPPRVRLSEHSAMSGFDHLKGTYFEECAELLDAAYRHFGALQEGCADADTVHGVFRAIHSIKGGGGAFGFERLVAFAHVLETLLDLLRDGRLAATPSLLSLLLRATDALGDLVEAARTGTDAPPDSRRACWRRCARRWRRRTARRSSRPRRPHRRAAATLAHPLRPASRPVPQRQRAVADPPRTPPSRHPAGTQADLARPARPRRHGPGGGISGLDARA